MHRFISNMLSLAGLSPLKTALACPVRADTDFNGFDMTASALLSGRTDTP